VTVRAVFSPDQKAPGARLRLGDGHAQHQFTQDQEQHRLTVSADLEEGQHTVFLHYKSTADAQGTLEIVQMHIQGMPMGRPMYDGVYHRWDDPTNGIKGELNMAHPGTWRYSIGIPAHTNHYGVGFA
jgi:hypothetical protein